MAKQPKELQSTPLSLHTQTKINFWVTNANGLSLICHWPQETLNKQTNKKRKKNLPGAHCIDLRLAVSQLGTGDARARGNPWEMPLVQLLWALIRTWQSSWATSRGTGRGVLVCLLFSPSLPTFHLIPPPCSQSCRVHSHNLFITSAAHKKHDLSSSVYRACNH